MRGHHNIHTIRRGSNFEHGHRDHGEWYGDKRENTFLTTRCEAPWKKKKVRNPRGVAEGKRVEERGASEKYAHEFVILLFSSFSFLSPSLSLFLLRPRPIH